MAIEIWKSLTKYSHHWPIERRIPNLSRARGGQVIGFEYAYVGTDLLRALSRASHLIDMTSVEATG